jgi:hypothetical protein
MAKVGAYRYHDLRHSYGTDLRAARRTFDDIAAIMGITERMAHVYATDPRERLQLEAIAAGSPVICSSFVDRSVRPGDAGKS